MDNGSNQRDVVPDTYDTSMLWGPSEFDARHIVAINYLYELPFFRGHHGFVGKALGGWQISGITQFQTGLPCSVAAAVGYAGVGLDSNFGCGVNGQYWVVNGDPKIVGTFGPSGQWFRTTNPDGSPIFTAPTPGTFNTQRVRDIIYQPGFSNWNMGLFKAFPINERWDSNSAPRPTTSGIIRTGAAPADAVERPTSDWTRRSFPPSPKCSPRAAARADRVSATCSCLCGSISKAIGTAGLLGRRARFSFP